MPLSLDDAQRLVEGYVEYHNIIHFIRHAEPARRLTFCTLLPEGIQGL